MRFYLFIFLFILLGCKKSLKNTVSNEKPTNFLSCISNITPYSKVNLDLCIRGMIKENDTGYFIKNDSVKIYDSCVNNYFNENKTLHDVDNFFYKLNNKKIYPFFREIKDDFVIIGSFIQFYGENDIPGVFFQLNLFNTKGEQIDYLVIYNRFSPELVFKYDFKINHDLSKIKIEKIEEDWLLFDEDGELIEERIKPKIKKQTEKITVLNTGFSFEK